MLRYYPIVWKHLMPEEDEFQQQASLLETSSSKLGGKLETPLTHPEHQPNGGRRVLAQYLKRPTESWGHKNLEVLGQKERKRPTLLSLKGSGMCRKVWTRQAGRSGFGSQKNLLTVGHFHWELTGQALALPALRDTLPNEDNYAVFQGICLM